MRTTIYALREKGFVRYVGKTVQSLDNRLSQHLMDARKGVRTHKCYWLRSMLNRGLAPTITTLEITSDDGSKDEIAWIKYFRDHGIELVNGTDGGDGNSNPSAETRALWSAQRKGVPKTPEHNAKNSAAQKGKIISAEQRAKISASHKGLHPSLEARHNMSIAGRNRPPRSPETCARLSRALMGHVVSPETQAKINKALRSPEVRAKIKAALMGHSVSLAARAKLSKAHKGKPMAPWTEERRLKFCTTWAKRRDKQKENRV
jgi:hypothetical protein